VTDSWKVLVIEDHDVVRKILGMMLGLEGIEVSAAPDGRSGLDMAREMNPDVVLLDVMMPDMDGFEVCRALKAGQHPPKVVMVTARGSAEDRRVGIDAGADVYIQKPFSPLEILHAVMPDGVEV
jgi:two-component system, OmpR family, phosphate regulon response regulator PhoB